MSDAHGDASATAPDLTPWVPMAATVGRATVMAIIVVNILNAFAIVAGPREAERYWFLLVTETGPSTWLSVTMLSGTALLAAICWRVDERRRRPFWLLVSLAALAMSLDDAAEVHERVGGNVGSALGDQDRLEYLWVLPWAAVAAAIAIALWRMRPRLPLSVSGPLAVGAGTTIGAALVLEVVAARTVNRWGTETERLVLYSVEENLELIGIAVFASTLAKHAARASRRTAPAVSQSA